MALSNTVALVKENRTLQCPHCCCFLPPPPGGGGSPGQPHVGKRKRLPVDSVFNKFNEEEADERVPKRKLVPLDYDDDKSLGADALAGKADDGSEEKRKHIKSLIEKIPTAKPELFSYPLDWTMVDAVRGGGTHPAHGLFVWLSIVNVILPLER